MRPRPMCIESSPPISTATIPVGAETADRGTTGPFSPKSLVQVWHADEFVWELAYAEDETLAQLDRKSDIRGLWIEHGRISERGLYSLLECPQLEHVRIRHAPITDQGIEILCQLRQLRILNLPHASFSDEGLRRLADLPNLEMLRFGSAHVSDDGIAALARAPRLRFLHIIDTPISARGLFALADCVQLESLYIDGAALDDQAVVNMLQRRPDLHLHLDQQHHDRDPLRLSHGQHGQVHKESAW